MRRIITLVLAMLALAGATSPAAQARFDDIYESDLLVGDPSPGGCCSCMCVPKCG
jgi:hypothetical protein